MRSLVAIIIAVSLIAGTAAPGLSFPLLPIQPPGVEAQADLIVEVATKRKIKKKTKSSVRTKHRYKSKSKFRSKSKFKSRSKHRKSSSKLRKRSNLPPALALIRKRLVRQKKVSDKELATLADFGDSLGAVALADRIVATGNTGRMSDAVYYYAIAASRGRIYALRPMVGLLSREDLTFKQTHLGQAEKALQTLSKGNNDLAMRSLLTLYLNGKPFGSKPDEAAKLLETARIASDGQLALSAAMQLLAGGSADPARRSAAIRYLKIAAASPDLGRQIAAANLLRQLEMPDVTVNTEVQQ